MAVLTGSGRVGQAWTMAALTASAGVCRMAASFCVWGSKCLELASGALCGALSLESDFRNSLSEQAFALPGSIPASPNTSGYEGIVRVRDGRDRAFDFFDFKPASGIVMIIG